MKQLALLALGASWSGRAGAAASYDLLPFEKLTADHRVLIGVPSGFEDLMGQKVGKAKCPKEGASTFEISKRASADHPEMIAPFPSTLYNQ
jgi:hypothetical protein